MAKSKKGLSDYGLTSLITANKKDTNQTRYILFYSIKVLLLLLLQIPLGWCFIRVLKYSAEMIGDAFYISSYITNLISISFIIYCYVFIYKNARKEILGFVKKFLILLYIASLTSYTFVSGSYSPFMLIGIKLANNGSDF